MVKIFYLNLHSENQTIHTQISLPNSCPFAQMAELVDALVSGTSVGNDVQVRVLFWAPKKLKASVIYLLQRLLIFGSVTFDLE